MYRRIVPAPAGLQLVMLDLFATVLCYWGEWIGSCKVAWGGTVGSASFSRSDRIGVMVCWLLNECAHGSLATCSCVMSKPHT